jgi:hypothetical protein
MSFVVFIISYKVIASFIDNPGVSIDLVVFKLALLYQTCTLTRCNHTSSYAAYPALIIQLAMVLKPTTTEGLAVL